MKKLFAFILILLSISSLLACGQKNADDPITKVAPGMSFEQAMEAEPTLTEYEGKGYSCSKTFADAEGTLLVSLSPLDENKTVFSILWQIDPTDGKGKDVYDALFSGLRATYGKPALSRDEKDVASVTGTYDAAQAQWQLKEYSVSCTYIEYHESGKCQIQYKKAANH